MPGRDGQFYLTGRSDDVMNINGVRVGTGEVEAAILKDKCRADSPVGNAIVVGAPHPVSGESAVVFVKLLAGCELTPHVQRRLLAHVSEDVGQHCAVAAFLSVPDIPETLTGKYMRRIVRSILLDTDPGDVSSLKNPESVAAIKRVVREWRAKEHHPPQGAGQLSAMALRELTLAIIESVVGEARTPRNAMSTPFMELGFRSLDIVEVPRQLSKELGPKLPVALLFDYPTASAVYRKPGMGLNIGLNMVQLDMCLNPCFYMEISTHTLTTVSMFFCVYIWIHNGSAPDDTANGVSCPSSPR
jgi:hypothetical protein